MQSEAPQVVGDASRGQRLGREPEQRRDVLTQVVGAEALGQQFPNSVGRITRYGTFLEHVWQPLVKLAKLPYRKPHAMRHSYATWMLEEGADLRYVRDQMGHASIEETERTYGHLEVERHERRVHIDAIL